METRAIIYTRVSTKGQGTSGLGLSAQIDACHDFCMKHNLEVVDVVEEVASGANDDRPILAASMRRARKLKALIVVARLDRLSRKVSFISALMEEGIGFASAEFGMRVNPLLIHIYAAVYEDQRKYIALRTKEALRQKKLRGEPLGNPKWRECIDDARYTNMARADKYALEIYPTIDHIMQSGIVTYQGIADALNARGVKTRSRKRGSIFHPTTIKNLLIRIEQLKEHGTIE